MIVRVSGLRMEVGRLSGQLRGVEVLTMPDARVDTTQRVESICGVSLGTGVLRLIVSGMAVGVIIDCYSSVKNSSVRREWLCQSGCTPWELSKKPGWRIPPCPASILRVVLHIALQSQFCRFFLLTRSPILNKLSGNMANCYNRLEWVHWIQACIGSEMELVTQ